MSAPELSIVAGALARAMKPKGANPQDALARRWRGVAKEEQRSASPDVIPLLDGWIRRLEREAGQEPADAGR